MSEYKMRIAHAYCLNNNIGDHALGIGVKNIFRSVFNVSLFADYNLQGQIFDEYFINIINTKYDLLIIGGGGVIHGAHWPQGWFWLIEKENIKKIKIPFIIYAAGYNYFKNEAGIPTRGIDHLIETHKRAAFFSVRNDGSHERLLEQTGINSNVIADPGFWIPLGPTPKFNLDGKYIVVQLANDKPEHRFGSEENKTKFIKEMNILLKEISITHKIVFAPHVFEDIILSQDIARGITNSTILDFGQYAFDRTQEFISVYQNADYVLAMRGHGQIIPLGFGVPVISLENHAKHKGLMEKYGLPEYNVDILDSDFTKKINEKITKLLSKKKILVKYIKNKNSTLLSETIEMLKKIDKLKRHLK